MSVTKKIKVTNHGMVNIPSKMRKKFQISDGDYVLIQEEEDFLKINGEAVFGGGRHTVWFVPNDLVAEYPAPVGHFELKPGRDLH